MKLHESLLFLSVQKKNLYKVLLTMLLSSLSVFMSQASAQTGSASSAMPSSGSCALLVTLPVPYLSTATLGQTGYNLIGVLTFTNATSGSFNGSIVNPTYTTNNSPYISAGSTLYLNNFSVSVSALNATNGFVGGYKLNFSGTVPNVGNASFEFIGVPTNSAKTILLQSSSVGTAQSPGIGPASGVCQS